MDTTTSSPLAAAEAPILLRCEALEIGYRGRPLLPPITLDVRAGELWAVIGRNGSGKTTLFRAMLGLTPALGGRVQRLAEIAYVAQRMSFDELYPVTVAEVVRQGTVRGWGFLRPWRRASVDEALDAVGATALADRTFRALSEGQKQRVLLARLVASGAKLALLDEPTAAMDAVAEREAMGLLDNLRKRYGLAVVVVSHHLAATQAIADKALFIDPDDQRVVVGPAQEVFHHTSFLARYGDTCPVGTHAP